MTHYDYKVIPAPKKVKRVKGVSGADELFAATLTDAINEVARAGLGVRPGRAAAGRIAARLAARRDLGGTGGAGLPPAARGALAAAGVGAVRRGGGRAAARARGAARGARVRAGGRRPDEAAFPPLRASLSFDAAEEDEGALAPRLGPAEKT